MKFLIDKLIDMKIAKTKKSSEIRTKNKNTIPRNSGSSLHDWYANCYTYRLDRPVK